MRTIVVDDEPIMIKGFKRLSEGIGELNIVGEFQSPEEALKFAGENEIELAVLDIAMPGITGIELAGELRKLRRDMLIVFVTAYDNYVREANEIGADYYIVKPYRREVIKQMAERMEILSKRQHKEIYVQTFGRFLVTQNGKPVPVTGRAKEILAFLVTRRGKEASNEEIYSTLWENRPYGNDEMKVYYNAVTRLRNVLEKNGIGGMLCSTARGKLVNTEMFDCDYYAWQDKNMGERDKFTGEFLSEYSWGEFILADMMNKEEW